MRLGPSAVQPKRRYVSELVTERLEKHRSRQFREPSGEGDPAQARPSTAGRPGHSFREGKRDRLGEAGESPNPLPPFHRRGKVREFRRHSMGMNGCHAFGNASRLPDSLRLRLPRFPPFGSLFAAAGRHGHFLIWRGVERRADSAKRSVTAGATRTRSSIRTASPCERPRRVRHPSSRYFGKEGEKRAPQRSGGGNRAGNPTSFAAAQRPAPPAGV